MKNQGLKISIVTSYEFWSAAIIDESPIDGILVGDSLAMVMHGHPTTISAHSELMALHVQAVARGAPHKFIIADMPFLSFRKGLTAAMDCVELLMRAGAHAVKLEGVTGHEDLVAHIVSSGVPVMGHLGLTPQSVHQMGGNKVQGRSLDSADNLLAQAKKLEDLGCFSLVLECIPAPLARRITEQLRIPTIGIGAGSDVSGQVLVLHDLLGLLPKKLKFARTYMEGYSLVSEALSRFSGDIREGQFPNGGESFYE